MKAHILLICGFVCLAVFLNAVENPNVPDLRLEEKPSFHLMGKSLRDNRDPGTLLMLWLEFFKTASIVPKPVPGVEYGLYAYGDGKPPTTDSQVIYLAGYEVPNLNIKPSLLNATTIPAARYAVFEHIGSFTNILGTIDSIFSTWLPAHNLRPAAQFYFERYDEDSKIESENSVIEIWVPVEIKNSN